MKPKANSKLKIGKDFWKDKPKSSKEKAMDYINSKSKLWRNENKVDYRDIEKGIDIAISSTKQECEEKIKELEQYKKGSDLQTSELAYQVGELQQQNTELLDNLAVIKSENIILKAGREELKKDIEIDAREIKAVHKENTELKEKLKELEGYQALRQGLLVKANKRNGGSLRFEK